LPSFLADDSSTYRHLSTRFEPQYGALWLLLDPKIETLYPYIIGFDRPVTTISLLQGDALGGGFEIALAGDILVAEKNAKMGFPEVLFNLFPGMGAYNLLSRRIGMQRTERMLLNGKLYRAEELHAEGVVDILAEGGRGENAVYEYIVRNGNRGNAHEGIQRVQRRLFPLRYEELLAKTSKNFIGK
jgi:DSF synthase